MRVLFTVFLLPLCLLFSCEEKQSERTLVGDWKFTAFELGTEGNSIITPKDSIQFLPHEIQELIKPIGGYEISFLQEGKCQTKNTSIELMPGKPVPPQNGNYWFSQDSSHIIFTDDGGEHELEIIGDLDYLRWEVIGKVMYGHYEKAK